MEEQLLKKKLREREREKGKKLLVEVRPSCCTASVGLLTCRRPPSSLSRPIGRVVFAGRGTCVVRAMDGMTDSATTTNNANACIENFLKPPMARRHLPAAHTNHKQPS
jgi:hypothetical protein